MIDTQALVELYRRGDYDELGLFDKQIEALSCLTDKKTTELLYGGAARGGKSVLGCRWIILEALTKPGSSWLIAREEHTKLKDTTMNTFMGELKELGLTNEIDYKMRFSPDSCVFPNGSRVLFREIKYIPSDPEFDRFGSYDLTGAFLDESQQIHEKAISVLRGRFSELSGDGWDTIPKLYMSCNPTKGWLYTKYYLAWKNNELPDWRVFVRSLPTDNPHNKKEYLENLLKSDYITVQRLYYGNWEYDDDENILMPYNKITDLWSNEWVAESIMHKYITADIAEMGSDKFVIWVWHGWVITALKVIPKAEYDEIPQYLRTMQFQHKVPRSNIVYDADGTGKFLTSYFKGAVNFHNNAPPIIKKKKDPNFKEDYQNLKSQCFFTFAEKVNANEIFFKVNTGQYTEDIKEELSVVRNASYGTDKKLAIQKKEQFKEVLKRSPDFVDSLALRMYFDLQPVRKNGRLLN